MVTKHTALAWLWALVLLVACLLPGNSLPREPVLNADKIFHAGAFGLLTFLWIWGWSRQSASRLFRKKAWLLAPVFAIAFGGLIELLQETVAQNRSADWLDWLSDALGSILGVLFFRVFMWIKRRKMNR